MIVCPFCDSKEVRKKGVRREKQRYMCNSCGQYWQNNILGGHLSKIKNQYSEAELKVLAHGGAMAKYKGSAPITYCGDIYKLLVFSDPHWGSQWVEDAWYDAAIVEGKRQGVNLALVAGDITEGMSGRDGHIYELRAIGYKAQRDLAVSKLRQLEIPVKCISGNHDLWYMAKGNMGGDIVEDICSRVPGAEYLGPHEADISINGIIIRLFHGEDASSYALSYRVQKIVESFSGGEKPEILITGHDHKAGYFFVRNVHTILSGCLQKQTPWMRRKKISAMPGFWVISISVLDEEVKWIEPRFYPFYE